MTKMEPKYKVGDKLKGLGWGESHYFLITEIRDGKYIGDTFYKGKIFSKKYELCINGDNYDSYMSTLCESIIVNGEEYI